MNTSRSTFLAVIVILGLALLACVGGVIGLTAGGYTPPDLLKEVAVGCLSGLGGMLVHPPAADPTPVVVQQPQDQPVPVDPTADPGPTFPGKAVTAPRTAKKTVRRS